jgi:Cu(I)/Ag(I) efflux system periplasmic protein CusF
MIKVPFASLFAILFALPALAQPQADDRAARHGVALASTAAEMSEGEIRKIDRTAGTITLKHGEIRNLGMPPMTMVFKAKSAALLDKLKVGDKVRFTAEQTAAGALIVTDVQPVKAKS